MSKPRLTRNSLKTSTVEWTWTQEGRDMVSWADPHRAKGIPEFWVTAAIVNVCWVSFFGPNRKHCPFDDALVYFVTHNYGSEDDCRKGWVMALALNYIRAV